MQQMSRFFLTLVLMFVPVTLQAKDMDRAAIEASAQAWLNAYHARDLEKLMTQYEPDAVVALNNQPALKGKGAIRDYFAKALSSKAALKMAFRIEDVQVHGQTAHLVSLYKLDIDSPGYKNTVLGRSLLIYKKGADKRWRILADIDNATPDATSSTFQP